MNRRIKLMTGVLAALTVTGAAQVAIYSNSHGTLTQQASWSFQPKTVKAVRDRAQAIVLAEVVSTGRGEDIVTAQPNEPGGVDRIPTTRVTIKVVRSYKGSAKAGEQVSLFQTGGSVLPQAPATGKGAQTDVQQLVLEGDPSYARGEQYLLMLEPGPAGTLRPVSPEGRFRYDDRTGRLTGMVKNNVTNEIAAQQLSSLEPVLRASS